MTTQPSGDKGETPPDQWRPETDPDGYTAAQVTSKDWHLNMVLDLVIGFHDDQDGSIPMTFQIGGALVTGNVISHNKWATLLADTLTTGENWPIANTIDEVFELASNGLIDAAARREAEGLPPRVRQFVHLKDATVQTTGQVGTTMPLWRGSLDDITGWTLSS